MWWSAGPYWLSDDFLAITYAHEPARALADLSGPQYGAPAMVRLYRPLITLSFALDAWIAGGAPWLSHLGNLLAHACSSALVVLLASRLLGRATGIATGFLWAVWPAHAGSILWAVGRVDSHTSLWILLSLFLTVRWLDTGSRGARIGSLLAFTAALLSKELALATPGVVGLLGFVLGRRRLATAVRAALPFVALLVPYFVVRYLALGRLLGGYDGAQFAPAPALAGLGVWSLRLCNPLWEAPGAPEAGLLPWLGFAPALLGVGLALRARRGTALAAVAAGFLLCALPTAPFWAETGEVKNLRYFYLPAACGLVLFSLGGPLPAVLALVAAAVPLITVRQHYATGYALARTVHASLRAEDAALPPGPLFVAGLPRQNEARDVLLFHLWVDRLLAPPFGSGRRVAALRPLIERDGVLRVPFGEDRGLGGLGTIVLGGDGTVTRRLPPSTLPRCPARVDGPTHLSSEVLSDLHLGRARSEIRLDGVQAPWLRLTLFTAGGYLAAVVRSEAAGGEDARVAVKSWLTARYATHGDDAHVLLALPAPVTFDVEPRLPLLVEAGDAAGGDPHAFAPAVQASDFLWFRFDRDLADRILK